MRSDTCRTTPRSCAMKMYVSLNSPCRSSSRFTICAWIETSSAETGSSATMSFGCSASARAPAGAWALPAGELVREAVVVLRRQPDLLHQLLHLRLALAGGADVVDAQRVGDDRADALSRVQA